MPDALPEVVQVQTLIDEDISSEESDDFDDHECISLSRPQYWSRADEHKKEIL